MVFLFNIRFTGEIRHYWLKKCSASDLTNQTDLNNRTWWLIAVSILIFSMQFINSIFFFNRYFLFRSWVFIPTWFTFVSTGTIWLFKILFVTVFFIPAQILTHSSTLLSHTSWSIVDTFFFFFVDAVVAIRRNNKKLTNKISNRIHEFLCFNVKPSNK